MIRKYFLLSLLVTASYLNLSWDSSTLSNPANPIKGKNNTYTTDLYKLLNDKDLKFEAFEKAMNGYFKLFIDDNIENSKFLTVIDLSLSANKNRFFIIDLKTTKIIHKSKVAHGRNSGDEFAKYFSNKIGSYQSSLGFYKTAETYKGKHGLSLRLDGLENSNNNARERAIVIHSADYVNDSFIKDNGRLGRSLGCPSLPTDGYSDIIKTIKNGSILFIYYPKKDYLNKSLLANSDINQYFVNESDVSSLTNY
ncbi:MAG: murein L,D-transpeptidase catalytic domain family protein [Flavobacteriaceae bacterium]|nr:murein L,D-transpeptidase catalytic domain family protein [Flavobacteriaceae bacterium]